VDGDAHDRDAVFDRLLDGPEARKRGQQGGVDVHDAPGETANEGTPEQVHEAGEHDQVYRLLLEPVAEREVARVAVRMVDQRVDSRLHPGVPRTLQTGRALAARGDTHHLDPFASVHRIQNRLEVGALSGDKHADAEGHAVLSGSDAGRQAKDGVRALTCLDTPLVYELIDAREDVGPAHPRGGAVRGQPVVGVALDLLGSSAVDDLGAGGAPDRGSRGAGDGDDGIVEVGNHLGGGRR
jgi:hypothetical protein